MWAAFSSLTPIDTTLANKTPDKSDSDITNTNELKTPNPDVSTYNIKLEAIVIYFGVSKKAAQYIYHRRRKYTPWTLKTSDKHLPWSLSLQNALVNADAIPGFDWDALVFGKESDVLEIGETPSRRIYTTKNNVNNIISEVSPEHLDTTDNDGWEVVVNNRFSSKYKAILKSIGLLPRIRNKRR
jgi:hypothetical protein